MPWGQRNEGLLMSKRILVADDSDTVRKVICTCLKERNFQVCGDAIDGEDVIEKARMLKPDLVLLDLAMPRTNGIVVASVLKEMMPKMRIVLFTMYSEAVRRTFSPKGIAVDAVIAKTDGMLGLIDCIQNLLPS
jgi:DNA-binding NarL/FixJ family response regulator